jgi:hypothetical protein
LKSYSNKLEKLQEIDKFVDTYDHLKLNQEDINHENRSIISNEIKAAINSLLENKSTGPVRFTAEFYQTLKEELISILLKLFHKIKGRNSAKPIL